MRFLILLSMCTLIAACAGNPPEWWNPTGRAPSATQTGATSAAKRTVTRQPASDELMLVEQNIDTAEENYEELDLSDKPAVVPEEETGKTAATPSKEPQAEVSPVEEHLPADGSLPPPSVLQ